MGGYSNVEMGTVCTNWLWAKRAERAVERKKCMWGLGLKRLNGNGVYEFAVG